MLRLLLTWIVLLSSGTIVSCADLTAATPEDQSIESGDVAVVDNTNNHRDLQLLQTVCTLVNSALPGDLSCTCKFTTSLSFECVGFERLCFDNVFDGYCSTPTVAGSLDILSLEVQFQFCGYNATNGGDSVPGLCINVGGSLIPPEGGGTDDAPTDDAPVDDDEVPPTISIKPTGAVSTNGLTYTSPMTSKLTSCNARGVLRQKRTCKSCQICNGGAGYMFDCTNIGRKLIQSSCTPIRVLSNLRPDQDIKFLPKLDKVPAVNKPPTKGGKN